MDASERNLHNEEDTSTYNIFFDVFENAGTDKEKNKIIKQLVELEDEESSHSILDITTTNFKGDVESSYIILAILCADYVTCPDSFVQEAIYNETGRLADVICTAIHQPMSEIQTHQPSFGRGDKRVGWFGSPSDIMSIKSFVTSGKIPDLKVYTPCSLSNTKTIVYRKEKSLRNKIIEDIDIVFLPKTSTAGGERRRHQSAVKATLLGKIVVAPNLEEYPIETSLLHAYKILEARSGCIHVRNEQRVLTELKKKSSEDLIEAIEETPDLEYKEGFDTKLDAATEMLINTNN